MEFVDEINTLYSNENDKDIERKSIEIFEKYKKVIKITDDSIEPLVNARFYWDVMNEDRIYAINDTVYKVIDDLNILYTKMENLQILTNTNSIDNIDKSLQILKYGIDSKTNTLITSRIDASTQDCWTELPYVRAWGTKDPNGCRDDRRVVIVAQYYWVGSNNYFAPYFDLQVVPERKYAIQCKWTEDSYVTNLHWLGGDADFEWNINTNKSTSIIIPAISYNNTNRKTIFSDAIGDYETLHPTKDPSLALQFISGEAYTQGTGSSNSAILNCDYQ